MEVCKHGHELWFFISLEKEVWLCAYLWSQGMMKRHQVPAFGYWDYCDELPITRYFESAVQAGLIRSHFFGEDDDLFNVSAQVRPAYLNHHGKVKKAGDIGGEKHYGKEQHRKRVKVISDLKLQATPRRHRAPKAVDEDLYKIPPELLYQKPKRVSLTLVCSREIELTPVSELVVPGGFIYKATIFMITVSNMTHFDNVPRGIVAIAMSTPTWCLGPLPKL
ncbi:hypothetical protein BHE74_00041626 [Ensete ventricosum]|nr:hypothetical protein BHE74_00041626 [Ensete ventricosum]